MADHLLSQITYASPSVLSTLGGWFEAGVVYLCETGGIDLRSQPSLHVKRQIQYAVETAATMGLTTTTWGFPTVPVAVLDNLYQDVLTSLNDAGFGVTYNSLTGLYVIAWSSGSSVTVIVGEQMDVVVETFPA